MSENTTTVAVRKTGLRKGQVRILEALSKAKGTLSRSQIAERSKNTDGQTFNLMGSTNPEKWPVTEERTGYPGLLKLKLVKAVQQQVPDGEGKEWRYEITAAGRKALAKVEG